MDGTYDFTGKTALVTGAARGIGLACAQLLGRRGAKLALADCDSDGVTASAGALSATAALGLTVDIRDAQSVTRMVENTVGEFGGIDIFVNCAAIIDNKLFLESSFEDWERILTVNLFGAMRCLRAVLPVMVGQGYGRIVYMASDSARIGQARLSYYAAAKGGVVALIKSVAQEVGKSGVTLNIVSPGATNTPLREERETLLRDSIGEERYLRREKSVMSRYPLGRLGEPEDVAHAVAFLSSSHASWITGQVLSVNGGYIMP